MTSSIPDLEAQLNDFDPQKRKQALQSLAVLAEQKEIILPPCGDEINLHCHTFFSFNTYGYSPSAIAWLSRKRGLVIAATIDFDNMDGAAEYLEAAALLGLRACTGIETRVFVPEYETKVINSPGEPGVAYHIGIGFTPGKLPAAAIESLARLRAMAGKRNLGLLAKVNAFLSPVVLDYEKEVLPLTPSGNATERHICIAYAKKAAAYFNNDMEALGIFWSGKLGEDASKLDLPHGAKLQGKIRAKTMKKGGVGYVQPERDAFPLLRDANSFILASGALPVHCWLDGQSDGERELEQLLTVSRDAGTAAFSVIPDALGLPVMAGTEMNTAGQKFVDDFQSPELQPLHHIFLKSAFILYGHATLSRLLGMGYGSAWAAAHFTETGKKNDFFRSVGEKLSPEQEKLLANLDSSATPANILQRLG